MIKLCIKIILLLSLFSVAEARKVQKDKQQSRKERIERIKKQRQLRRIKRLRQKKQINGFQVGEKSFELLLGQPSGIRYQQWTGFKRAFNLDLAYHTKEQMLLQTNYLFYYYSAKDKIKRKSFWNSTFFYYGPGIFTGKEFGGGDDEDDFLFGVRGFVGLDYLFVNSKYAMRTEVAMSKYLSGDDSFGLQIFIGLAYHWDRKRERYYKKLK